MCAFTTESFPERQWGDRAMNDILELRNVSVLYGGMEKTAVTDVSLCIPERSIVAIVGESGSGKSTLIRAILGLLSGKGQVTQGEIFFKGVDLAKLNENEYRKLRGKSISMIFQNAVSALDSRKKIGFQFVETIRASAEISKVQAREHAVNALLEVGLSDPGTNTEFVSVRIVRGNGTAGGDCHGCGSSFGAVAGG